eukprot:1279994-Prorocentrum_lima.AAC.1
MTSSLVGSEMCIRDSHWYHQGRDGTQGREGGADLHPGMGKKRQRNLKDCLLYTSDAADDM